MPRPVATTRLALAPTLAVAIALIAADSPPPTTRDAAEASFLKHIQVLAGDEFEGRGPGTPGEEKSVAYIQASSARSA